MAKTTERLSAVKIANLKGPGYFADGANLYLRIAPSGARGWIFRFTSAGKTRDMGLGSFPSIGLSAARQAASKYREMVKQGMDPIERRRQSRATAALAESKTITFDRCAVDFMTAKEAGWSNAKHREQWRTTLDTYASPVLGPVAVADIDAALVLRALEPIWQSKPETASRLRGRIEAVLDYAKVRGYRIGENPARWRGNLKYSLSDHSKVRRVKHYPALPYVEIRNFIAELRQRPDLSARALEFLILTAARSGEALGATWDEIDLSAKVWTVPAIRMKAGEQHRVPLSSAAVRILKDLHAIRTGNNVFLGSGARAGGLSGMALLMLLRRMKRDDVTVHGFRSTFRDWAAERTHFPREVAEMALAHAVGNAVEAAYRRSDLFDKRRKLMEAWAEFCASATTSNDVVPLRRRERNSQP